jgi:cystathionine gamma-synthase
MSRVQNCISMADSMSNSEARPETIAAHALRAVDATTGAASPPIHLATTFARNENYETLIASDYQRSGSPTVFQLEDLLAALEKGAGCLTYPSGMAAIFQLVETVPVGGHVVAPNVMYFGARVRLQQLAEQGRITLTLVPTSATEDFAKAIVKGKTNLVWIETPSNPMWDVTDISAVAELAHKAGAALGVDATTTGAVTTLPLTLGADYVFHSVTKYLNGHSDVLGGALITKAKDARWEKLLNLRNKTSAPLAPFEAWMVMRGMRTLFVRYRQASANALAIARHFANHPQLEKVIYPGLPSHAGYEIARKQMTDGYGGMMSLLIKTDFKGAQKFCTRLKVITPATSLGGCESLAEHRKTVEGPQSPVPDNLVRLSIGIENVNDLIADIEQALATH